MQFILIGGVSLNSLIKIIENASKNAFETIRYNLRLLKNWKYINNSTNNILYN